MVVYKIPALTLLFTPLLGSCSSEVPDDSETPSVTRSEATPTSPTRPANSSPGRLLTWRDFAPGAWQW